MTMPEPEEGESQEDYLARCVPQVMKEGATQKQALGKCYGMWRSYHRKMPSKTREYEAERQKRRGGDASE